MERTNSKRVLFTANHVSTTLSGEDHEAAAGKPEGALRKLSFLRALRVTPMEVKRLGEQAGGADHDLRDALQVAASLETMPHLAAAARLARVSPQRLLEMADQLGALRGAEHGSAFSATREAFAQQVKVSPIGRLHLERLEMYTAGVERGELVFTVPMAPGETVTVSHKEWSTSSQTYEDIVQDAFESYSERGVAEKTDASMSTQNETKHADALNFGATLTGSYGPVSLTTTLGLNNSNETHDSLSSSVRQNKEVTEKASARARQEHKVSIKLESSKGTEDTSFRTITNPGANARRIDYYKMMRKWKTDLFRYGLRMTYDLAIPTPGVRLWARWRRIAAIDAELQVPFVFALQPQDLSTLNYVAEGAKAGALNLPDLPDEQVKLHLTNTIGPIAEGDRHTMGYFKFEFDVPAGYEFLAATATAHINRWVGEPWHFRWYSGFTTYNEPPAFTLTEAIGDFRDFKGATGHLTGVCMYQTILGAALELEVTCSRTHAVYLDWRRRVWEAIQAAARTQYQERMARLQAERDRLWRELTAKDTLSLRRIEREEMLRLVMLWLLGPASGYTNAPGSVQTTIDRLLANEQFHLSGKPGPVADSPTFTGVSGADWSEAILFGELVKFVQQAVEWENLLYFPYAYFWGSENQGRDKLLFECADPEHQRFLRAGYMRVVLTIRPSYEEDFTRLVETGSLQGGGSSPYLPIAQEIANFARTNYMGIPPANPEKHARPLLYPQQRRTWALMETVIAQIEQFRADEGHYPATLADLPAGAPDPDAWGNALVYNLPGSGNDYDLISLGADAAPGGEDLDADISSAAGASLVATWFEYTPTSGIDLEVDTKPVDIA